MKATAKQPAGNNIRSRILLVDDHPIMTSGVAEFINHEVDLAVCGVAADNHGALEKIAALRPDLEIVDVALKASNGIELLKDIKARHPKQAVLMLSMHDESVYAARALRAGAVGYVMKQEATDCVLAAIRKVLQGEIYLSERMEKRMMLKLLHGRTAAKGALEQLSDRELEVFNLIGQGYATRQIAEELHLSIKTIESHRGRIKDKFNLKNSAELVQQAIQWRTN